MHLKMNSLYRIFMCIIIIIIFNFPRSFFILLCGIFTLLTNVVLSHFNYRVSLVYVS